MATVSASAIVVASDVSQIPGSSVSAYTVYDASGKTWHMTGAQVAAGTGGKAGYFDWTVDTAALGIPLGSVITKIQSVTSAYTWQAASAAAIGDYSLSCALGAIVATTPIARDYATAKSLNINKSGTLTLNSHISNLSLLSLILYPYETFYATDFYIDVGTRDFTITYTPPASGANTFFKGGF